MSRSVWFRVAALGWLVTGCASHGYLLQTDHFTLVMPRDWQVVRDGRSAGASAVVRPPAPATAAPGAAPELRFYVWLESDPIARPTEEALGRLVAADELGLRAARPADRQRCALLTDRFTLFGAPRTAVHLETATEHLIVVAGQAQGSLVAVVGITSVAAASCGDIAIAEEALRTLRTALTGSDRSTRPPPAVPAIAPLPPFPAPVLPSPTSP